MLQLFFLPTCFILALVSSIVRRKLFTELNQSLNLNTKNIYAKDNIQAIRAASQQGNKKAKLAYIAHWIYLVSVTIIVVVWVLIGWIFAIL